MNTIKLIKSMLLWAAIILVSLTLTAGPSLGATIALKSEARPVDLPDGAGGTVSIPMWGFFNSADAGAKWLPGPTLTLTEGDSLTIDLTNNLPEAVSIVIAGQQAILTPVSIVDSKGRSRVTGFDSGASFVWNNLKAGTYLYQSGTHPAKQVQMGLYGALIVRPANPGLAYAPTATNPDTAFDSEVVLLYSEIDPALHSPVGFAQPLNYIPAYYLINGKPYKAGDSPLTAGDINKNVLIRLLNAGLKTHVPTLLNAPYMRLIAEDGNLYPYAKSQYSVMLAAGKTIDAIWQPTAAGTFPLMDRANHLTTAGTTDGGMLAYLQVGGLGATAPVAVNDSYTVTEGGTLTANGAPNPSGVLANDTGANLVAVLVGNVSNGSLALDPSGTFVYTHNGGQTITDSFSYKAKDNVSLMESMATVSITVSPVNDPPVAVNDSYAAVSGSALNIAVPGVLGNDSDVDGDALTAVLSSNVSGGALTLNANGSFSYTPNPGTLSDSFTYRAKDAALFSNIVTVSISVSAPVNTAPVAVDDNASTRRNTAKTINLIANDTDAQNNLKDASGNVPAGRISIVTQPTQNGTLSVVTNGVIYTPRRNFRGTDVFTYRVTDTGTPPLTSNTATVRVNVTN
ncbi:MAG: Ig-like domain-containing protein [Pseudomonadota bacterium]